MKKKISAIILTFCMLIAIAAMSTPVYAASASSNVANGWYRIKHVGSGKYLDIAGVSMDNGAKLQIYPSNWNRKNQTYYFERLSDGTYRIKAMHSNKYIEVDSARMDNYAPVQQWTWNAEHPTKRWYVYNMGSGNYKFINKNSGKAMDVYGGGTADGTKLVQYTDNGTAAQRFKLERVNTFSDLKTKFPNNKYWNRNGPDSYSSTPCTKHTSGVNSTCNGFAVPGRSKAYQYKGYSNKLVYEIYGQSIWNWSEQCEKNTTKAKNYLNSTGFKAGDVVRWNNDGHQILITGYNASTQTYTFTDCNSDYQCKIRWGVTITKSALAAKISGYNIAPHCAV